MEIKKLSPEHAQTVADILLDSFTDPWSVNVIRGLIESTQGVSLGAFEGDELVGYAVLEYVLDEGSLTDIVVDKEHRRKGIARRLLEAIVEEAKDRNLIFITLEVRASNIPAISLYKDFGFESVGKRPAYYKNPTEDALLMTKNL